MNREHKAVVLILQTHFGEENDQREVGEVSEESEESAGDRAESPTC